MKNIILMLFVVFAMAACTTLQDVDESIMSGEAEAVVFQIEYTDAEKQIIRHAISEYHKFHDDWKAFIISPVNLLKSGNDQLHEDYQRLRERYFEIEKIVTNNYDRYDEESKKEILRLEAMAKDADRSMNVSKTVHDVAVFGELVARMAAKML